MRMIRDKLDSITNEAEKSGLFLQMIAMVPTTMAARIADIAIKGQDLSETPPRSAENSLDQSMTELMRSSTLRKDFKIEGKIGKAKDNIDLITLNSQIAEGERKGYSPEEIAAAIKRAVVPGEVKTYLDSMTDLSLEDTLTFIRSALKEKSSSELFQNLMQIVQGDGEDPQTFLMRAIGLRQKCLVMSEKSGEVAYSRDLVQTIFMKAIRTGLTNDVIKSRLEAVINRAGEIGDSALIQAMNEIASEEAERDCKRGGALKKSVKFAAVSTGPSDSTCPPDLQETVSKLAEQMTVLSVELPKLKSQRKPLQRQTTPKAILRRSCPNCAASQQNAACRHCWECGESDHLFRDCPTKSN